MQTLFLKNIVWREGKFYVAKCLNVEVSSFGETKKEALDNLNEALELYFEDCHDDSINTIEHPELIESSFVYA